LIEQRTRPAAGRQGLPVVVDSHQDPSRSAVVAAFWSTLCPGLGQLYHGRRRAAAVFGFPLLALALILAWQAFAGIDLMAVKIFTPGIALTVVALTILFCAWRLVSMADAFSRGSVRVRDGRSHASNLVSPWRSRRAVITLAALAATVILAHGIVAWVAYAFYDAGSQIFVGTDQTGPGQTGLGQGTTADPQGVGPLPTPYATPPSQSSRINFLLIGADSGMGYNHSLTDTMIVVSVDPVSKKTVMLSFPRDISRFAMYNGGTYEGKLNSLVTAALDNPTRYPDGGLGTLTREVGFLLGVPIHYYAFVNLAGFKTMIDTVGGVDVLNPHDIADPIYQFPDGQVGFSLSAGPHHLDGRTALAYVRSRLGPGDNDFTRAARQQELLVALRGKLTSPTVLANLPALLKALSQTIQTDYPAGQLSALLTIAKQIDSRAIDHYVLGPPYARNPPPDQSDGVYMLVPDMKRIMKLSVDLFGADSVYSASAK
jgi:LCP family protein required for cell wall assembly